MELHATGCNAWGQLNLDTDPDRANDLDCLTSFTKVLAGNRIEKPVARLTHTLVKIDNKLLWAGHMPGAETAVQAASVVMAANGEYLENDPQRQPQPQLQLWKRGRRGDDFETVSVDHAVQQMAAYDTGFVILYDNGTVATRGDPRFPAPLGRRPITNEEPAEKFVILCDLSSLDDPVVHITACAYTVAALTRSGSVYVWGQKVPSRPKEKLLFPEMQSFPNYVEVANGKDIRDFALGDSHAIILTTEGEVYVIGSNESGQLGIGISYATTWTKIDLKPSCEFDVVGVAAGPRASFLLLSSDASAGPSEASSSVVPDMMPIAKSNLIY